jgi:hypothetical protein
MPGNNPGLSPISGSLSPFPMLDGRQYRFFHPENPVIPSRILSRAHGLE